MNAEGKQIEGQTTGRTIHLAQTLHGYADGHQLLEGVLKLPRQAARLMNILSDLSGPEMIPGFETYLTGYPISNSRKYALARTWYAPEMKRPGCVWTHTILIDFADLAQIDNLRLLLRYFRRPVMDELNWLGHYQEPISFDLDHNGAGLVHKPDDNMPDTDAVGILRGLYEQPGKCVILFAASADTYQDFVLRLWSQQWPRLRRAFRFTTGALSLRQGEEESNFDLQITPRILQKQLQQVLRTEGAWLLIDSLEAGDVASWCACALADLKVPYGTKLRDFLWRFGVYVSEGRAGFASLVRIFERLSQLKAGELEPLLALLAELFPKPEQAAGLKKSLLGETIPPIASWGSAVTEAQVLSALTKTQHYPAFDPVALGVSERASALMSADRNDALQLAESLLETVRTTLAKEYLKGIIQNINSDELVILAQRDVSLVAEAVALNPGLAGDVRLWRSLSHQRSKLLGDLRDSLGNKVVDELIQVLLEANADGLADELAHLASPEALVGGFLQWFNQKQAVSGNPPRGWTQYLSWHQPCILDWLRQQSPLRIERHTSQLLAELLDPHDRQVIQLGAGVWERVAAELGAFHANNSQQRVAAFLLALGFHNPSPSGAGLVSYTFAPIYIAARENRLDERSWGLLREQAPSDRFWEDWDKCVRLACALLDHFVRYDWPEALFANCLTDAEVWNTVLQCSKKHRYWRRYIQHVSPILEEPDTSSAG